MKFQTLPDSFEQEVVPEIIRVHYRQEQPTTVRVVTPNWIPRHDIGTWMSPNPRLIFDIRFGRILPRIADLQAAPTDLLFTYISTRSTQAACELARAIRRTTPKTRCFLVSCECNQDIKSPLEREFGPLIWTPDCGGNLALPLIIDILVDNWPIE